MNIHGKPSQHELLVRISPSREDPVESLLQIYAMGLVELNFIPATGPPCPWKTPELIPGLTLRFPAAEFAGSPELKEG